MNDLHLYNNCPDDNEYNERAMHSDEAQSILKLRYGINRRIRELKDFVFNSDCCNLTKDDEIRFFNYIDEAVSELPISDDDLEIVLDQIENSFSGIGT